jgi:hypothetical protein
VPPASKASDIKVGQFVLQAAWSGGQSDKQSTAQGLPSVSNNLSVYLLMTRK